MVDFLAEARAKLIEVSNSSDDEDEDKLGPMDTRFSIAAMDGLLAQRESRDTEILSRSAYRMERPKIEP